MLKTHQETKKQKATGSTKSKPTQVSIDTLTKLAPPQLDEKMQARGPIDLKAARRTVSRQMAKYRKF